MQFSRAFVDGYERERWRNSWSYDRVLMNLHNNEAGRKVFIYVEKYNLNFRIFKKNALYVTSSGAVLNSTRR